jgi:microcystin-dependent protein
MSDNFIGEIRAFSFNWRPTGWALCNGALLSIQQNAALYSLLGTQFGGDGKNTFALPDLQGRTPVHAGGQIANGTKKGAETTALAAATTPAHTHTFFGSTDPATSLNATGKVLAVAQPDLSQHVSRPIYGEATQNASLIAGTISAEGAGAGHQNMQPFTVINFCIALNGIYPSRP